MSTAVLSWTDALASDEGRIRVELSMNLHHVWHQGLACLHSDTLAGLGGCWEQNVEPLQEKGPLTTESSPQPPVLKGVFF